MTEHRVTMSDGASLFVKLFGSDDDLNKPLVITHHGAPGLSSHREPESTFSFLQSKFRVLVYDARGSGISDLQPPYTHERWVADVEELRKWAGADKFILAGGSYGGFISLEYALVHQDRLLALILRDTWAWGSRGMMQALKAVLTSKRVQVNAERQYKMWTGIMVDDEDFAAGVAEMSALFSPENVVENIQTQKEKENTPKSSIIHAATHNFAFSHNMPRFDIRARLKEITTPALVIVGRYDLVAPVEFSEELAQELSNAKLVIFEKSGHNPAETEPQALQESINGFLAETGMNSTIN